MHKTDRDTRNVLLWAISRSRSTAFERSVMQHPDIEVFHELLSEPFLRGHFPDKYRLIEQAREQDRRPPGISDYQQALDVLAGAPGVGRKVRFSKEIAYFFDFQRIDADWLGAFRHVFLVREPEQVMRSLYRVSSAGGTTYFDADESGFDELAAIHALVVQCCAKEHLLYLDSEVDLMGDPQGTMERFCAFAGVQFLPAMLEWQPEQVAQWQFFKGWHNDAERSCGFNRVEHPDSSFPPIVEHTAWAKSGIYRFFQLAANCQRDSWGQWLKCLDEPGQAELRLVLVGAGQAARTKALELVAGLAPGVGLWWAELDGIDPDSVVPGRELASVLDLPTVLVCPDNESLERLRRMPGLPRESLLCLVVPRACGGLEGVPSISWPEPDAADPGRPGRDLLRQIRQVADTAQAQSQRLQLALNLKRGTGAPSHCWSEHMSQLLQRTPDRVVARCGERALSARQLHAQGVQLAMAVQRAAHGEAGWVAIHLDKDLRTLVAMTACSLLGWPYLDVPGWYSPAALEQVANTVRPRIAIVDHPGIGKLLAPEGEAVLYATLAEQAPLRQVILPDPVATDIAYGLLTSGTTGTAKVVLIEERGRLASLGLWQRHLGPADRVGLNAWLTGYVFLPVFAGAQVCIIPDAVVLDPVALRRYVSEQELTQLMITPSLIAGLLEDRPAFTAAFAGVTVLWSSGEALSPVLRRRLLECLPDCLVLDLYGSNEAGDVALCDDAGQLHLVEGSQAMVLDGCQRCTPLGGQGELYVATRGLCPGYLGDDRTTREALVENPLAGHSPLLARRLLRTGDIVRLGRAGELYLQGRSASFIKVRGFKVPAQHVEQVLREHPRVVNAWVTTRGAAEHTQLIALVVTQGPEALPTAAELRGWASARLAAFAVPVAFFAVPSLPASASQKRLGSLTAATIAGLLALDGEGPSLDPLQQQVATIWRQCLDLDGVQLSPASDFMDLGGSLRLLELASRLGSELKVRIGIADIVADATLQGISQALAARLQGRAPRPAEFDLQAKVRHYQRQWDATGLEQYPRQAMAPARRILLTGATGYLGGQVLQALRASPGVQEILCLVRPSAGHLVRQVFAPGVPGPALRMVVGDLRVDGLGLAEADRQALGPLDCIMHCAAQVNWLKSYESLAPTNVEGTLRLLQLGASRGARMVLASTLAEPVATTGYNRSKRVAEELALAFCESRGLPLDILRCGDISAPVEATRGQPINDDDYVGLLLRSCLLLQAWPEVEQWTLNLTPVDYVARVFSAIALAPGMTGSGLRHLYHPAGNLPWNTLCRWAGAALDEEFRPVDLATWNERLQSRAMGNAVLQRTAAILPMIISDFSSFDQPPALVLDEVACPPLDAGWVQRYIGALYDSLRE
ncbi:MULTISPECIES: AMP-binding protein [unclassified Pseudomonas]|uniref:AMP-binding protein n=1 Tax=unclassified Pseudomonas TaxID=196821 RepID=UPI000CD2B651|nr:MULTISPECIES: AMP-binding protein [unclassified Pseudomonas]POA52552.1 pyoverdine sidechain peptide synthetase [Pseudomonas sp. FW507-12TSA]